tara:strand:+ start:21645 stop:22436 length:792 start_codon:yes stop_codon:yes gene_type:complete
MCNDDVHWSYSFGKLRKTNFGEFERLVVVNVAETSNMGAAKFRFPSGVKTVYRSSFLSGKIFSGKIPYEKIKKGSFPEGQAKGKARQCLQHLIEKANIRQIVNLYDGSFKTKYVLSYWEKTNFLRSTKDKQGSFGTYTQIKDFDYDLEERSAESIYKDVISIIAQIESVPGNALIHCYGGMHRTGIVFGVMQKCLNGPKNKSQNKKFVKEVVDKEYKCHTDYKNAEKKGGYHQENMTVIENFPCDRLHKRLSRKQSPPKRIDL